MADLDEMIDGVTAEEAKTEAPAPDKEVGDVKELAPGYRPALGMGKMVLVQSKYKHHWIDVPPDITPSAVLEHDYLKHHARMLRPLDRITAFCEDGSWEADYRVMSATGNIVILSPLSVTRHDSDGVLSQPETDYLIVWKGPTLKFCIIETRTGKTVARELFPKAEAEREAINFSKSARR